MVVSKFVDDFVCLVIPDIYLAVLVTGCVLAGFF
jgi:hypothetical protein